MDRAGRRACSDLAAGFARNLVDFLLSHPKS
jgi:hypothetical protein